MSLESLESELDSLKEELKDLKRNIWGTVGTDGLGCDKAGGEICTDAGDLEGPTGARPSIWQFLKKEDLEGGLRKFKANIWDKADELDLKITNLKSKLLSNIKLINDNIFFLILTSMTHIHFFHNI